MYLCIDNVYNKVKVAKDIDEAVLIINKMILECPGYSTQEKIYYTCSLYEQQEHSASILLLNGFNTLKYQILPLSDAIIKTIKEI